MESAGDITIEILKEIRDGIRQTNVRLDETRSELSERIDLTRTELSGRMDQLQRRQTETEVRLATELVAVVGAVHSLKDALLDDRRVRHAVDDHEARIRALERRAG